MAIDGCETDPLLIDPIAAYLRSQANLMMSSIETLVLSLP